MTIPAGAGSSSAGSQQETHAPDDADPGLPAATGSVAAGGPSSGHVEGTDQAPEGVGSAGDAASTGGSDAVGKGGAEAGPAVGDEDPSGI